MFIGFSLFDPVIVRSEFHHTVYPKNVPRGSDSARIIDSYNMFAIVREARGWAFQNPNELNIIVRDLLYIRRENSQVQTHSDNGNYIGIYLSTVDKCCFYIEKVEVQESNVVLTARTISRSDPTRRVTLIFPATPGREELHTRDGVLSGWAGNSSNLAAWKCLLIRPDWDFFYQLRTMLAQASSQNAAKLFISCRHISAIGVYFSTDYVNNDTPIRNRIHNRREVFRKLIMTEQKYSRHEENISRYLRREISDTISLAVVKEARENFGFDINIEDADKFSRQIMEEIVKIFTKYWHFIEPAQIITFRDEDHPQPSKESVKTLLELTDLSDYM